MRSSGRALLILGSVAATALLGLVGVSITKSSSSAESAPAASSSLQRQSSVPATVSTAAIGSGVESLLGDVARWQWVLGAPFDIDDPTHLGTNWRTAEGTAVPPPSVYDVDGFTTDPATVQALHARGALVVCYIETGAWESYRPDADRYPSEVLGLGVDGYPNERYVDIRSEAVFDLVRERVEMCATKGFDAVEPDIDDSYTEDTGFAITQQDNLEFNARVAELARSQGLLIALKNGDEPDFAAAMEPIVDFAVVEQCFEFDTCSSFDPFLRDGKAVLVAEYNLPPAEFCPEALTRGIAAVRMTERLTGEATPCT